MSQPFGCAVSRRFRVKNIQEFGAIIDRLPDLRFTIYEEEGEFADDERHPTAGMVSVYADGDGFMPTQWVPPGEEEEKGFDLVEIIHPHLCEGETAVFELVTYEGQVSCTGAVLVIAADGRSEYESLDDLAMKMVQRLEGQLHNLETY